MRLSELWLRSFVNPSLPTQALVDKLIMAGLEVESFGPVASNFTLVKIGEVISAEPHPNADRLKFCRVNVGNDELLSIVCGAANVRAGLKVPVAMIGAELPNDFKIKNSKIRGVESQGMICSRTELGLAEEAEGGIMELPHDAPVGQDFREYLQLNDNYIEIELTPNRGDCLSVVGIAREVAAITHASLKVPEEKKVEATSSTKFAVNVLDPKDCPRYVGRVISNINSNATTPIWMSERLRRSGVRSIHPVVDITNYILLELGQPLHAFDLDKLAGGIQVRHAQDEEKIALLNNQEVTLKKDTLIIADDQKPLAIAGIMGGVHSSVTSDTTNIFLESAFFTPLAIANRARRYNAHSDSSHRYERGVDPFLQVKAIEYATDLVLQIVGGETGPLTEVLAEEFLPIVRTIHLRKSKVQKYLGLAIAAEEIEDILQLLNFKPKPSEEGWEITVPTYRFDIVKEIDLIEEVARLYGYDKIPSHFPSTNVSATTHTASQVSINEIKKCLVSLGYQEAVTYSFVEPKLQQKMDPTSASVALINPISADLGVMRTSLWTGLLNALLYNQNRQQDRIRLFEVGRRFIQKDSLEQQNVVSGIITGSQSPEQWGIAARTGDFFDVKGDVESLLALTRKKNQFSFVAARHEALDPGQCAKIYFDKKEIGLMGALHPSLTQELQIKHPVYVFEIEVEALTRRSLPRAEPLSKYPLIRRDIAILLDKQMHADQVENVVKQQAGELLTDFWVFDVYDGKGIPQGKKSLAIALILQHQSRTLRDTEVTEVMSKVIEALQSELKATLRE